MCIWKRMLMAFLDDVPQNPDAVLYGTYEGMPIRLRPIVGPDNRITKWVPDPDTVRLIEDEKQHELATAPALPAQPPALPPQTAQTAPGGFNPAGVAGL